MADYYIFFIALAVVAALGAMAYGYRLGRRRGAIDERLKLEDERRALEQMRKRIEPLLKTIEEGEHK